MLIPSYGKVYNLGKTEVRDIFTGRVLVQEKIDGSQFSFLRTDEGMHFRSRNNAVPHEGAGQFQSAVTALLERQERIPKGVVFRGEVLSKPKHNVLAYQRTPRGNVILFDAQEGINALDWGDIFSLATEMDLETVPCFEVFSYERAVEPSDLDEWISQPSILGGMREGVVIKNYGLRDPVVPTAYLKAKYVAPAFREVAGNDKRPNSNSSLGADILTVLGDKYRSEARWHKAIQRRRDDGQLDNSPKDIGPLLGAIVDDVKEECEAEIKEALFKWAWKHIGRQVHCGFPEWYKEQLVKRQFETE